jgi:type III pantothenate kinase
MEPQKENYLIIDQGNTLTKIALFEGDDVKWVNNYSNLSSIDIKSFSITGGLKAGIISSVAQSESKLTSMFPNVPWIILSHETKIPIKNKYKTPESLGKDRLAAVVAASNLFEGCDVLVIDAGTAITYDLINKHKEYQGGSISPGLSMRFKALNSFTGRLPLIEIEPFDQLIGLNTYEAILSGVMNGARVEMEGIIKEYQLKFPDLKTILTGGDAIYFDKKLKSNIFVSSNLVILGLKQILKHNFEK